VRVREYNDRKGRYLRQGHTKSCGRLRKDRLLETSTTHGMAKSPEYINYRSMLSRCYNPRNKRYKDYGGRRPPEPPITVCDLWRFGDGVKSGFEARLNYIRERLGPLVIPSIA
jgi:hypothetical protein